MKIKSKTVDSSKNDENQDADNFFDSDGLPLAPNKAAVDPSALKILWIAPPGWGKTTSSSALDDVILLAHEEGHNFVNCTKIVIDSWDGSEDYVDRFGVLHLSYLEAVNRIIKSDRFKHVIHDTIDACCSQSVEHFLKKHKATHPNDLGDYGRGWDICRNKPVIEQLNRIIKSGRGVSYLTHLQTKEIKKGKGDKQITITQKGSTLSDKIFQLLHAQCDAIFHGEFGEVQEGNEHRDRIVHTEGSEEILAKNRTDIWPKQFILPESPEEMNKLFKEFLTNPESRERAYQEYLEVYGNAENKNKNK